MLRKVNLYEVWNKQVGHISNKILKFMFDAFKNYYSNYEVYSLSKHTKLSFYNSNFKNNKKFELVQSDVWGPTPITSCIRYFIIFIVDFSKIT
jgi:hypothetical protein